MQRVKKAKLNNSLETDEALRYLGHVFGCKVDLFKWRDENDWSFFTENLILIHFKNGRFVFSTDIQDGVVSWNPRNHKYICYDSINLFKFDYIHKYCTNFCEKYTNYIKFYMKMQKIIYLYTLKSILLILGTWRNSDFSLLGKDVTLKICRIVMNR